MNTNSPSLSDVAQELVAMSERDAQDVLRALPGTARWLGCPVPEQEREQLRLRLQTQFLFPQLAAEQRGLLVALYWESQSLTTLVNVSTASLAPALRGQTERITGSFEQSFMSLVRQVKDLVPFEALLPVQRIIFDQEYAQIRFSEALE